MNETNLSLHGITFASNRVYLVDENNARTVLARRLEKLSHLKEGLGLGLESFRICTKAVASSKRSVSILATIDTTVGALTLLAPTPTNISSN